MSSTKRWSPWSWGQSVSWSQWIVLAAFAALLAGPGQGFASELDKALLRKAPTVIKYLQEKGYKNVGVLKFRAKKGDEKPTDNIGPLNMRLANGLEVALVLSNDLNPDKEIKLIRNASAVASSIKGATHLTPEGRKALFGGRYSPAWGDSQVTPDAFVTGWVKIATNMSEMTVALFVYGPNDEIGELPPFTIKTDVNTLIQAGESFNLRKANFASRKQTEEEDTTTIVQAVAETRKAGNPPSNAEMPVLLKVYYDGRLIEPDIKGGKTFITGPRPGQTVSFVLRRNDSGPDTFGVVLMLNGENTLFRQKLQPIQCRRWILEPGDPPIMVRGFQMEGGSELAFKVSTSEESKENEIKYGADVGTISFTVFRKKTTASRPDIPDPESATEKKHLALVARGELPKERAETADSLRSTLEKVGDGLRDPRLIEAGEMREGLELKRIPFEPDPTPVASLTLIYYQPQRLPR